MVIASEWQVWMTPCTATLTQSVFHSSECTLKGQFECRRGRVSRFRCDSLCGSVAQVQQLMPASNRSFDSFTERANSALHCVDVERLLARRVFPGKSTVTGALGPDHSVISVGVTAVLVSLNKLSGEVLLCGLTTGSLLFRTESELLAGEPPRDSHAALNSRPDELNTLNHGQC